MSGWNSPGVADWERAGQYRRLGGHSIFVMDVGPTGTERSEPMLIIHGFPTSSFDFRATLPSLAEHRRVVLLDLLGYGLSDKPDIAFTVAQQADVVMAVVAERDLDAFALLTHDMGDTVGGELLARHLDDEWPVTVTRRIVTNGSIYMELAQLTPGQRLLLALPDERLPDDMAPNEVVIATTLANTMSPDSRQARADLAGDAELIVHGGGNTLLPRTVRYLEERLQHEDRYTGAIETHPSPVGIVWGTVDPIAVAAMASRFKERRPDSALRWMEGVGHYPMLEAPGDFVAHVEAALSETG
jgi:pimeloyl-ACP methyl ester carboxylesterase